MVREAEDALICDFAAEYGVLDWRALPVRTAAALACGLSEDSRTARRRAGAKYKTDTLILAAIADGVNAIRWMLTDDGAQGRNHPPSILAALLGQEQPGESDIMSFEDAAAYREARARQMKEMNENV